MLIKKVTTATLTGLATLLAANVAIASDFSLSNKELNGRSDYIGVTIANSDLADIAFSESRTANTAESRNGRDVKFGGADGILGSFGQDYGYVRLETEFGYRDTKVTSLTGTNNTAYANVSGKANIGTAMINLAIEYSVDPGELSGGASSGFSLTPYITAGGGVLGVHGNLGYNRIEADVNGVIPDGTDEGFFIAPAVQGGAGLTLGLPYGAEIFGQYSQMLAYTHNVKNSNDIHIKTVSGGLRLNF